MKNCTTCKNCLDDEIFFWNARDHKACHPCVNKASKWQQENWDKICVKLSKIADRKSNRPWKEGEYVTPEFLLAQLEQQWGVCYWCGIQMSIKQRNAPHGLTIERLDNRLPHTKKNSVLACHRCNVRQRIIWKEPFLLC